MQLNNFPEILSPAQSIEQLLVQLGYQISLQPLTAALDKSNWSWEMPVLQISASQPFRIQATNRNSVSHAKQPGMWPILSEGKGGVVWKRMPRIDEDPKSDTLISFTRRRDC